MKTLFFIRHAQAKYNSPSGKDIDREIDTTGYVKAQLLANELKRNNFDIQRIISSPAKRALQTAKILKEGLSISHEISLEKSLYFGNRDDYLKLLYALPDELNSVMIVGHNPTISDVVWEFNREIFMMKTSQMHMFQIDTDLWTDINISKTVSHFSFLQ